MAPPDFVKIAKRTFELGWCHENRVTTKALYLVCMRLSLIPRTLSDKNTHPNSGAIIRFRSDGGIFNLQHLNAWTKVSLLLLRELLFADDCALIAHTEDELQSSLNDVATESSITLWPYNQHNKNRSDASAESRQQLPSRSCHLDRR